jgi:hypothetical protein
LVRWSILRPIFETWLQPLPAIFADPPDWISTSLGEKLRSYCPRDQRRFWPGKARRLRWLDDPLIATTAQHLTQRAASWNIDLLHPLLDHRLVEFAASLPVEHSFRAGLQKAVLRDAMKGLLPDAIVSQRYKVTPGAIAESSLRSESSRAEPLMRGMRASRLGFVDESRLRSGYARFQNGLTQDTTFWHALTLEAWLRTYFPS